MVIIRTFQWKAFIFRWLMLKTKPKHHQPTHPTTNSLILSAFPFRNLLTWLKIQHAIKNILVNPLLLIAKVVYKTLVIATWLFQHWYQFLLWKTYKRCICIIGTESRYIAAFGANGESCEWNTISQEPLHLIMITKHRTGPY